MTIRFTEILRRTLAVIERNEEFRQESPAIVELRRGIVRSIGEFELMRAMRSSDTSAKSSAVPEASS